MILSTLTPEQRDAVVAAACPWCKYHVPFSYNTSTRQAVHHVDEQTFPCKSWALRQAIISDDRFVESISRNQLNDIKLNGT